MEIKKRSMLLANSALYFTKNLIVFFLATFCMIAQGSIVNTANNYTFLSNKALVKVPPSVMILMSRHHSLFKLAYVDSVDINNDGIIDTGYLDTIEYTGYFNSAWCYQYDSGKNYFAPVSLATGPNNHHCDTSSAPWSGNFLNWATMTRADIVRLVFYGGKRVIDTASETVLERAGLTGGLDSFAKVYNQPDIKKYTPYNHTTSFCNTQREEPLLMVAAGSYPRWALSGTVQCAVGKSITPVRTYPASALNVFQHRVAVCVQGKDASDLERCKSYGTSGSKPVGLLQNYGEGGGVFFGLMDTSVTSNGGRLRANIRDISDEINPYNGTFTSVNGVIYHLNVFDISPSFKGSYSPSKVTSNSIAEAYSEALRYFAGQTTPRTDFQPTLEETTRVYTPAWKPPLTADNSCSNCSIIVVSSTDPSYDTDHMAYSYNLPNLNSLDDIKTFTNAVGNHESKYTFPGSFVHSNAGGSVCQNQPLSSLSEVIGLCPSEAYVKGGYYGAGLAYYANTTDLLPSLAGKQSIKTYVLQMETSVPFISVPVGTNKVLITGVCTYCNFRHTIVENIASDGRSGSFYSVWSDKNYDYTDDDDFDAASRISYCVADVCTPSVGANQIRITVEHAGKFTSGNPNFSYSVTGTTNDGINPRYTTEYEFSSPYIINDGEGTPISTTYTVSSSSPTILPSPLWLMAKYGGFNDLDSDGSPNYSGTVFNSDDEWDKLNNTTGVIGGDGEPDNYLLARQPNLIKNYLNSVLQNVVTRYSAGANVSILAKNNQGTGMLVQPLFRMNETINGKELSWIGLLNAYFIDDNGFIREDSNKNAKIDSTDRYLEFSFDAAEGKTLAQRSRLASDGKTLIPEGSKVDIRELKTLWSAHEALLDLYFHVENRVYHDKAEYARYIFTWLDSNNDGAVNSSEIKSFDYLGALESELQASLGGRYDVLLYTMGLDLFSFSLTARGFYIPLRSRSVDDDGDGRTGVWKLGDIINSTPVSVAEPQGLYGDSRGYDRSDQTFLDFKSHYNDRRTMVYVGANDGLLHAFNAGFWDAPNQQFLTSRSGKTAHALGTELWAYAPMNLLPHYQWLTSLQYQHIPYMDGSGQVFDVNIFADDADHPGGWGTILVMGMGFGGGDIDITLASGTVTRRSAYVVLDITNPEKPPVLLAELTHPELGFTTMKPALVRKRKPSALGGYSSPSVNDWYLVFGSGPKTATVRNTLNTVSSTQNLKVFVYDLNNKSWVTGWDPLNTGIANSYSGDMTVADWNEDYSDDVLYFGSVNTASSTLGGQLNRIDMISDDPSSWRFSTFVDIGRPIVEAPLLVKDTSSQHWVYAGTGRDIIASDRADSSQEYSFGVKEPLNSSGGFAFSEVSPSDLVDTTDVVMSADGTFASPLSIRAGNTVNSFSALEMAMNAEKGWINKLQTSGSKPSAKRSGRMTSFYTSILSVDYMPPEEICEIEGNSFLNAQHYKTGTAIPSNIRRILTSTTTDSTKTVTLGKGKVDGLNDLYTDASGNYRILTQGEAGNLTSTIIDMTANNVTSPPSPTFRLGERESWQQIYNIPR